MGEFELEIARQLKSSANDNNNNDHFWNSLDCVSRLAR